MKTFKVLSLLLSYPESDWLAALPELEDALMAEADFNREASAALAPLFTFLKQSSLIEAADVFVVETHDRPVSLAC